MGVSPALSPVAPGASGVEKHFTLARADGGVDSTFSLEPHELAALVTETERAWQSLGGVQYGPAEAEKASARFRRSLYIASDMKAGDVLTAENLRVVRPGYGLAPKYYDLLLGRRVNRHLKKGTAVEWGILT
jgi:N-acetylneuraminate synthase